MYRSAVAIEKESLLTVIDHKWLIKIWLYYHNTILLLYVLLIVQELMKIIVTNQWTDITPLFPIELLTDTTNFNAAILTKIFVCITTFYYNNTLLLKLIWWLFELVFTNRWRDRWTDRPTFLSMELLSQQKIITNHCVSFLTTIYNYLML